MSSFVSPDVVDVVSSESAVLLAQYLTVNIEPDENLRACLPVGVKRRLSFSPVHNLPVHRTCKLGEGPRTERCDARGFKELPGEAGAIHVKSNDQRPTLGYQRGAGLHYFQIRFPLE